MYITSMRSWIISILSLTSAVISGVFAAESFEFPYGASDVSVVNTSHTEVLVWGDAAGNYQYRYSINILLAVKNKSSQKDVGVRFTNDSWTTYSEALATFTKPLDNGYELWTIPIERGIFSPSQGNREYEVAAFVSYNKEPRAWDPQNNYYIYQKATPKAPVALVGDIVSYDRVVRQIVLKGSVRTYSPNRAADYNIGGVVIRWTVNNWKTFEDFHAFPITGNDTWNYKIPVAIADPNLPNTVDYAIQYKTSAGPVWINNNGRNYSKKLRPTVSINYDSTSIKNVISGDANTVFYFSTDLTLGLGSARSDDAPYYPLTKSDSSNYRSFIIFSKLLENGPHTLDVSMNTEDGPEILKLSLPFDVKN
ncbi:hypothetical protein HDU67_008645 [Dinochytrium kinnereticum]|nr:hypothetical protein HDU67_008645 [Dinochytrium kinnereticum]